MVSVRYVGSRALQTVFLLWFMLTFLFFFFRLMPGSYLDIMMYRGADPESIAVFKENWGLNDPLYVQYGRYLVNFLGFDAGLSVQYREPVWDLVRRRMFNTFILVAPAITLSYVVGGVIGGLIGSRRDSRAGEHGLGALIFVGSLPSFFVGILLIAMFSMWAGLFPTSGMVSPEVTRTYRDAVWWRPYLTGDFAMHYTLPFVAIVFRYLYFPSLIIRTSFIDVTRQEFNEFYRVAGLTPRARLRHQLKHASLPLITLYPLSMTWALGGMVLIETVFNWPGIGQMLVQAVLSRDYPVIQFVFFIIAAFVILSNFVVDLVYGVVDPRISADD
ncbi:ABC transporter permease [Natronobiforma cellulositropha]|uniref:ABC transporter permease n=1 Tax=Natronobiforma cellulositropha TaxID=1679076 RepID=UPI0021D59C20|nr:ABC transporter permease [Natronobiforma cellulositropha]